MTIIKTTLLAGAATLAFGSANAQTAYLLGNGGDSLVIADVGADDADDATSADIRTTDGDDISLTAITYRPQSGQLYGYDEGTGTLYTIDPVSGVATVDFVFSAADAPRGNVQFDTNPNVDAFRFVTADGSNVVYFPDNTATAGNEGVVLTTAANPDTIQAITYGDGFDGITSATGTPLLVGNGYTNQLGNADALMENNSDPLLQYVLDAQTDSIGILNNNAGTVDFAAFVQDEDGDAIDFDVTASFDVFSDGSTDIGYALLNVDGEQTLYSVDLVSFIFTALFEFDGDFGALVSLAVFGNADVAAPVPVPAAGLLFAGGIAGAAAARRRKKAAA